MRKTTMKNDDRVYVAGRRTKVTKVERYGWTIQDAPGRFAQIPKGDLLVDATYQRNVNDSKSKNLAGKWSWIACGALIVVQRGKQYYVIDGQHRLEAAKRRTDIESLPCLIFRGTSLQSEANGFIAANKNRRPLSYYDMFKAQILSGDEVARRAAQLLETHNYLAISPSAPRAGRVLCCLRSLTRIMERNAEQTERIFPLIIAACEEGPIDDRILLGLDYLETHGSESLTVPRWSERVKRMSKKDLLGSIARTCAAFEKGGPKRYAEGIAAMLNRGLRPQNELQVLVSPASRESQAAAA